MLGLIAAGSIGFLVAAAVVVVLVVRKDRGDGDGAIEPGFVAKPIDSSRVTEANFRSLRTGMTLGEVENILGGSRSSSSDELKDALRREGFLDRYEQATRINKFDFFQELSLWRRWESKDARVWVGFGRSKDANRAAFSICFTPFMGRYKCETGLMPTSADEMDSAAEFRKQEQSIRGGAKWVTGAQARGLLLGEWRDEKANGYLFGPNGKLSELSVFEPVQGRSEPTYRIVDDRILEILTPSPFAPIPGHPPPPSGLNVNTAPTVARFEYFVNQDELGLINITQMGTIGAPKLHRSLYRMPVRAGSPGETKVLGALLADLKGADQLKRNDAFEQLRRIGKGGAIAIPALLELLRGRDSAQITYAAAIIGDMKEAAAPALPTLIALLKDASAERAVAAAEALGRMGPAAITAVAALSDAAKKSPSDQVRQAADVAIRQITNRTW
jgi:hypothetical protein